MDQIGGASLFPQRLCVYGGCVRCKHNRRHLRLICRGIKYFLQEAGTGPVDQLTPPKAKISLGKSPPQAFTSSLPKRFKAETSTRMHYEYRIIRTSF